MRRFGPSTTEIEFWIECDLGHTTNKEIKLVLDDENNVVIQGMCECSKLVRECFPLKELQSKAQTIAKETLEL